MKPQYPPPAQIPPNVNKSGKMIPNAHIGCLNISMCQHCKFLYNTFLKAPDSTERDYYLMTEVFVYLHGGDVCNYSTEEL